LECIIRDGEKGASGDEINSGITVVMPVIEILAFLHSPQFVAERAAAVESRLKLVGKHAP
jgi:hypothetical protein